MTPRAADDLHGIYEYMIVNFGLERARGCLNDPHHRFDDLAERPALGRGADRLAPGLRRYPYRSHVVFYMPENGDMLIVRVLHERMDTPRHFDPTV